MDVYARSFQPEIPRIPLRAQLEFMAICQDELYNLSRSEVCLFLVAWHTSGDAVIAHIFMSLSKKLFVEPFLHWTFGPGGEA